MRIYKRGKVRIADICLSVPNHGAPQKDCKWKESQPGISFFDPESLQLYPCLRQIERPKERLSRKASVSGRKAVRFAAVLASPASSRTLRVNFSDTCPSSFVPNDSVYRH